VLKTNPDRVLALVYQNVSLKLTDGKVSDFLLTRKNVRNDRIRIGT
jgi:hypothetical protein